MVCDGGVRPRFTYLLALITHPSMLDLLMLSLPTQQSSKRTYTHVSIWQSKQVGL